MVAPAAAGLGDVGTLGLALAVDCAELPQAAVSSAVTTAAVTNSLDCMHDNTEPGYEDSATRALRTRP